MGVSRRAYAKHRGVSEAAVRRAISNGRITVLEDGTIDVAQADRQWASGSDPAQVRPVAGTGMSDRTVPSAALAGMHETLRAGKADPGVGGDGEAVTFAKARTAKEVLRTQLLREQLRREKGETVDKAKAQMLIFDLARRERDAWLAWPARVAAQIAADLGADQHQTEQVLDRHLREHLASLAEVKVSLG